MKLGVFSDIHGNLDALRAVLAVLQARGVAHFICCGDVVGYGPDPVGCIETLRDLKCQAVAGNHDYGLLGRTDIGLFNRAAAEALLWARERVAGDNRLYLEGLPLTEDVAPMLAVHSSPSAPEDWEYVFTVREAEEEMDDFATDICLIGHTHYPFAVERLPGERARLARDSSFEVRAGAKYVVNVGSVGQSRDGDRRACCLLYDSKARTASFLRVDYDIRPVQRRIREAGLPEFLATRLASGR
ncbi:metallophosphoesterase family protein [candidate division WOR-3 bacterium]|nr:metallophosphoesterase family protein [candidate division WOR-3 bacterium]